MAYNSNWFTCNYCNQGLNVKHWGAGDDFIEIHLYKKEETEECLRFGTKVIYSFHTDCLYRITQDKTYTPTARVGTAEINRCKPCGEEVFVDCQDYVYFFRTNLRHKDPSMNTFISLFHEDCFESVAGDVLPLDPKRRYEENEHWL